MVIGAFQMSERVQGWLQQHTLPRLPPLSLAPGNHTGVALSTHPAIPEPDTEHGLLGKRALVRGWRPGFKSPMRATELSEPLGSTL